MAGHAQETLQPDLCAEALKALGEPIRLRMIDALRTGPLSVSALADVLDTEIVNVSHHLKILRHAHLVQKQKQGRFVVYRLHDDVFKKGRASSHCDNIDLGCCKLEIPRS